MATMIMGFLLSHGEIGEKIAVKVMKYLIGKEIKNQKRVATLFRDNSLTTYCWSEFAKTVGYDFMTCCIKETVEDVLKYDTLKDKSPYEVRLNKIEESKREDNIKSLSVLIVKTIETIIKSKKKLPKSIVEICECLKFHTEENFKDSAHIALGGFIFLRLLCPALVSPEAYYIIDSGVNMSHDTRAIIIIISKILVSIANQVDFGEKQSDLICFNGLINNYIPIIRNFLCNIGEGECSADFLVEEKFEKYNEYVDNLYKLVAKNRLEILNNLILESPTYEKLIKALQNFETLKMYPDPSWKTAKLDLRSSERLKPKTTSARHRSQPRPSPRKAKGALEMSKVNIVNLNMQPLNLGGEKRELEEPLYSRNLLIENNLKRRSQPPTRGSNEELPNLSGSSDPQMIQLKVHRAAKKFNKSNQRMTVALTEGVSSSMNQDTSPEKGN